MTTTDSMMCSCGWRGSSDPHLDQHVKTGTWRAVYVSDPSPSLGAHLRQFFSGKWSMWEIENNLSPVHIGHTRCQKQTMQAGARRGDTYSSFRRVDDCSWVAEEDWGWRVGTVPTYPWSPRSTSQPYASVGHYRPVCSPQHINSLDSLSPVASDLCRTLIKGKLTSKRLSWTETCPKPYCLISVYSSCTAFALKNQSSFSVCR